MLNLLRQRNFSLLWFAGLTSMLGDWVLFVALPVYTYELTRSSLATGLMFMAGVLPRVLVGSLAGVIVDRSDRKKTMVLADLSRAVLLLLLLWVKSPEQIWIVYLVAFLQSTISQFFGPAENALLPQLVDESHLVAANSLNTLNNNLARLAGPALGGLLFGLLGFTSVVFLDSLSFLISGLMIAMIIQPSEAKALDTASQESVLAAQGKFWKEWADGFQMIFNNRVVSIVFLVIAVASVAEGVFSVLFIVFVNQVLNGNALDYGWLISSQAVGGLIGGLLLGWMGKRIKPNLLIALLAINGFLILLLINLPSFQLSLFLLFLAGIPITGFSIGIDTLLQQHVADKFRGRIFGTLGASMAVFLLIGQGLASGFGDHFGAAPMLNIKGVLDIVAGLLAIVFLYKVSNNEPPSPIESNL